MPNNIPDPDRGYLSAYHSLPALINGNRCTESRYYHVVIADFFNTLDKAGLLAALPNETMPPKWLAPHTLGLGNKVAVVGYSSSGIMYNRHYLAKYQLPLPTTWQQLASPLFMGHVMMSSPSQSGTTHMMVESVLQQYGWQQGWALLMRLGGNLSAITARSFGVSDGISRGLAGPAW